MSKMRIGIGRGLDALMPNLKSMVPNEKPSNFGNNDSELQYLSVNSLCPGEHQPRQSFDPEQLEELAISIRENGLIQPIIVSKIDANTYEIIAGERRWRAAKLAGLAQLPVLIKTVTSEMALAIALIENMQRQDLNPVEEAVGLNKLLNDFSLTHDQVARFVGKSRAAITNLLRILNLEDEVKSMLQNRLIDLGHAKALLALPADLQVKIAHIVVDKNLSVRQAEEMIQKIKKPTDSISNQAYNFPQVDEWCKHLSNEVCKSVDIHVTKNGKGRVVINFDTIDELALLVHNIKLQKPSA